jgi:hypothetical protein
MANEQIMPRDERLRLGPPTTLDFERLVDEAATVRLRKVLSYGESRYRDDSVNHAMTLTYGDIYRKYIRIRELILRQKWTGEDGEALRDAFLDMANYGLMGVQLWDKFMEPHASKINETYHECDQDQDSKPFWNDNTSVDLSGIDESLRVGCATHEGAVNMASAWMETARRNEAEVEYWRNKANAAEAKLSQLSPEDTTPRVDQIAIFSRDPQRTKQMFAKFFDIVEWADDHVVANGRVFGQDARNNADLAFNYQLMGKGLEFEILHYPPSKDNPNWLEKTGNGTNCGVQAGFSHLGMHVDDNAMRFFLERAQAMGIGIAQEVYTESHTNPAIKDSRRYHYVILDTRVLFGFDLKLIERLPYDPSVSGPEPSGETMEATVPVSDGKPLLLERISLLEDLRKAETEVAAERETATSSGVGPKGPGANSNCYKEGDES